MRNNLKELLLKSKTFKWKKLFCWHLFPFPEDKTIESVYEIIFYLLLLLGCCVLYKRMNHTDYRNIIVDAECLDDRFVYLNDSLGHKTPTLEIKYMIPMTYMDSIKSKYTNRNLSLSFSYLCKTCNPIDPLIMDYYALTDSLRNQVDLANKNDVVDKICEEYKLGFKQSLDLQNLLLNYKISKERTDSLKKIYDSICFQSIGYSKNQPLFYYNCRHNIINKDFNNYNIVNKNGGRLLGEEGAELATGYWENYLSDNFLVQTGFVSEAATTITINDPEGVSLGSPQWYVLYDISQSYYDVKLKVNTIEAITLELDFLGATRFSNMTPEPDEITFSSIKFCDPIKIMKIKSDGLKFHANFVELEGEQSFRLFCLSALMGALATILIVFAVLSLFKLTRTIKGLDMNPNDGKDILADETNKFEEKK